MTTAAKTLTDDALVDRLQRAASELLPLGDSPQKVIGELEGSDPDFARRQVGIVDRHGRAAAHTGKQTRRHNGALTGDGYVAMGNLLATAATSPPHGRAGRTTSTCCAAPSTTTSR